MHSLKVKTSARSQALDITRQVAEVVAAAGVNSGWCEVFVPHTTAAVAVNEAADPAVMADLLAALERLVPWQGDYRHTEGNAAAHVKSVLVGGTVRLPVSGGRLSLGTWQGVFFLEFDGPRNRQAWVEVL
ncbi:MAG: YjbQ family protein [Desulfarculus sp.]|nr:MAG: YjbQ family protein [Desulfarculus sp.]